MTCLLTSYTLTLAHTTELLLVMKDNYKAMKFFVEFYRLLSLLNYNDNFLQRIAYVALLKRIKDEMVHFDKPQTLNRLQDLVQKIHQHYWE